MMWCDVFHHPAGKTVYIDYRYAETWRHTWKCLPEHKHLLHPQFLFCWLKDSFTIKSINLHHLWTLFSPCLLKITLPLRHPLSCVNACSSLVLKYYLANTVSNIFFWLAEWKILTMTRKRLVFLKKMLTSLERFYIYAGLNVCTLIWQPVIQC